MYHVYCMLGTMLGTVERLLGTFSHCHLLPFTKKQNIGFVVVVVACDKNTMHTCMNKKRTHLIGQIQL